MYSLHSQGTLQGANEGKVNALLNRKKSSAKRTRDRGLIDKLPTSDRNCAKPPAKIEPQH